MKKRILCTVMAMCMGVMLVGCSSEEAKEPPVDQAVVADETIETAPEPNTSEMVDSITRKAKEDAANLDEKTEQEALDFIQANYNDYFVDNETMEKTMYYGALLEYAHQEEKDTIGKIGMDAVQVVKYVYRNNETPEDQATLENLKQIKDGFAELGITLE